MQINEDMKSFLVYDSKNTKPGKNTPDVKDEKKDKIEISNTSKAFDRLNDFMNLGKPGRMDISDLSPEEREEFLKMLADLLKNGIVGYEVREVDGKPEKHFIVNEIGDERLYGTKLYKKKDIYYNR